MPAFKTPLTVAGTGFATIKYDFYIFLGFLILIHTFTTLKRILTILIVLIGLSFNSFSQSRAAFTSEAPSKIIKFFPNPATTVINFEFQGGYDKSYTLQFYNFMGKKVNEFKPGSDRINISLEGYYRGVYIYQLRDKNGKIVESGKFQVVR